MILIDTMSIWSKLIIRRDILAKNGPMIGLEFPYLSIKPGTSRRRFTLFITGVIFILQNLQGNDLNQISEPFLTLFKVS